MLSALRQSVSGGPPIQNGLVDLALEYRAGRTRLTRARTRPPLLVQQALYPDEGAPDMAYVFLANPTGGLLENDRQHISVSVGSGARGHVTTQSATKIHTMADGVAEQRVTINVAAGGYLEYLPDPLIPFRDASLVQSAEINIETGGALVYGDVITPGRVASGESFKYRRLSSRLSVYRRPGRPAYIESFDISAKRDQPMGMAVLGVPDPVEPGAHVAHVAHTYASLLVLCDASLAPPVLSMIRETLATRAGVIAGASGLPDGDGVGVKVVGPDRQAVQSALNHAWSAARLRLLGVAEPFLRKY